MCSKFCGPRQDFLKSSFTSRYLPRQMFSSGKLAGPSLQVQHPPKRDTQQKVINRTSSFPPSEARASGSGTSLHSWHAHHNHRPAETIMLSTSETKLVWSIPTLGRLSLNMPFSWLEIFSFLSVLIHSPYRPISSCANAIIYIDAENMVIFCNIRAFVLQYNIPKLSICSL